MMMMMKLKRPRPRAYVMMEAMIGGALLAVALTSAMSFVGFYRRETTVAARRAQASSIATTVTDELVSRDFGVVAPVGPIPYPGHPGFTYSYRITQSGIHNDSTPPLTNADELHLISVTVTFKGSNNATTSLTYERYKRKPL